jgi:hypothetical protein
MQKIVSYHAMYTKLHWSNDYSGFQCNTCTRTMPRTFGQEGRSICNHLPHTWLRDSIVELDSSFRSWHRMLHAQSLTWLDCQKNIKILLLLWRFDDMSLGPLPWNLFFWAIWPCWWIHVIEYTMIKVMSAISLYSYTSQVNVFM